MSCTNCGVTINYNLCDGSFEVGAIDATSTAVYVWVHNEDRDFRFRYSVESEADGTVTVTPGDNEVFMDTYTYKVTVTLLSAGNDHADPVNITVNGTEYACVNMQITDYNEQ